MTDANILPKGPPRLGPAPKRMVPVAVVPGVPGGSQEKTGKIPPLWLLRRVCILVLGAAAILLVSEATGFHLLRGAAFLFVALGWVKTLLDGAKAFGLPLDGPRHRASEWACHEAARSSAARRVHYRRLDAILKMGH